MNILVSLILSLSLIAIVPLSSCTLVQLPLLSPLQQHALAQNQTKGNFLTYTNSTYGIKIQYSSDWLFKESNASNNSVQTIVSFAPSQLVRNTSSNALAVLTIAIQSLPFHNLSLDTYTNLNVNNLRQSNSGFKIIDSNNTILAGSPAHKITYTTANGFKTMAVYAIKGDKAYLIEYITRPVATFSTYLPIAQKMIDSFQTGGANTRQSIPLPATTTTPSPAAVSPLSSSTTLTSNTTKQKATADFKAAREQYLFAWNHTGFHSQFDTYINSTQGYGVYQEHKSTTFRAGEPIILYVEPVGFTHIPLKVGANNTKLYLVNLTAGILVSDKQGNVLFGKENIPLLNVISHNKNTEVSVRLSVTQSSPFPAGKYVIAYTVNDVPSGKSFKIVRNIAISGSGIGNNKTSTSTTQQSSPPNNSSAVPPSWHSYTNSTYGIALRYPPDWILSPLSQPNGTNNTNFEIMDFAPPISQDPTANTILGVGIDNTTRNVTPTLEQYLHDEINGYRSAANVTDFKVIKVGTNVTVGGHPGYLLYFTEKLRNEPTPRTYVESGTIAGNTIYYLSINSAVSDKQFTTVLLPQAIQIIKSFHILQPAAAMQQQATPKQLPGNIPGFG